MRQESLIYRCIFDFIALIVALCAIFPLIWLIIAGFKPESEVLGIPFKFFPKRWTIDNYVSLLKGGAFIRSMCVTFFVASVTTVCSLFLNSLAAYAFARMDFPLKKILWSYVLTPMFVPGIAILIPSYIVVSKLHMVNTLLVLILPFIIGVYGIFFIRQFYLGIPSSYEDAATMDGASFFKIYTHIFVPLSKPPFVLIGVGAFLGSWNSYLWPAITISNERLFQIMQLLAYYRSQYSQQVAMQVSGSAIAAMPTIILFLIFQKHLIQGIKISGLK